MMAMKKIIIPAIAVAAIVASCAKTPIEPAVEDSPKQVNIVGTIYNEEDPVEAVASKSDYDVSSGDEGIFHWSGTEQISILKKSEGPNYTGNTFTGEAASNETSITFSGIPNATDMDYALYPGGTSANAMGWSSWTGGSPNARALRLQIKGEFEYDAVNPLKNLIPMIGKKDGSSFVFKPATAVIAVSVKNLPSSAQSITLSSSGSRLSGYYLVTSSLDESSIISNLNTTWNNGLTVIMAANSNQASADCSSKFTFSSGLDRNEHTFYFPVSVGTLSNGLVITIKDGGGAILQTVTYTKSFETRRGQISKLPLMDLAKATTLVITGTADAPTAYVDKFGPEAVKIKYAIASSVDDAKTAAATGTEVTSTGVENKFSIAPSPAATGQYYLGYVVYDSSSNVLGTYALPYGYLGASDVLNYTGQFAAFGTYSSVVTETTITLAVSDNPAKGNIMITEFDGLYCDVSNNTHGISGHSTSIYNSSDFSSYTDGQPIYGVYSGTPGSTTNLRFKDVRSQVFYTDKSGTEHFIGCDSGSSNNPFADLEMSIGWGKVYRETNYKFICTRGYLGNYYKVGANVYADYRFYQFGAGVILD